MRDNFTIFTSTAKGLARNPLGIIALFIVLIYGFACLVIICGSEALQKIGNSPLIWFLSLFPVAVLAVFAWLVAWYHKNLYGPLDLKDERLFYDLATPPPNLPKSINAAAVSDSAPAPAESESAGHTIDSKYSTLLQEDYFLFHAAEVVQAPTSPGTGFFRVRVWIEALEDAKLKRIGSVTYRVWDDFPETRLTTTDRSKRFDVWLNANGEFPILACINLAGGQTVWRSRYLDLPGRPKDADEVA